MSIKKYFDVIVIGGGHAGTEASIASAKLGSNTLLITQNIDTIGQMSCNPAIGGIGKGHLVKEIDALGGVMGIAIDFSGIQFRILNSRKGSALRATRAQSDRFWYKYKIRSILDNQNNLKILQQEVEDIILNKTKEKILGVITKMGLKFYSSSVVLTTGTFLGGKICIGNKQYIGGRFGDAASNILSKKLRKMPFKIGRLKTGTPPRIDGKTINFSVMEKQKESVKNAHFSFINNGYYNLKQISCYITYTNENTHKIIKENLHYSSIYSGNIIGNGPRYCPSIEDKIVRFKDKLYHQIFIEPEGINTTEIYPNGISTSLPCSVQNDFIHSIKGLENAHIIRYGYAIEYDFFDPRGLHHYLETKCIKGLFFAGQINGTTGYEEAAAQGLIAGINASRLSKNNSFWFPKRNQAYIGVLIDDLVTLGTKEPYRMFTSRAEYRLFLREDNADDRLTPIGKKLGLVDKKRWEIFQKNHNILIYEKNRLKKTFIHKNTLQEKKISSFIKNKIQHEYSLEELIKRPEIDYSILMSLKGLGPGIKNLKLIEKINSSIKYAGYIARQNIDIAKVKHNESICIPKNINYKKIKGLSNEVIEKLNIIMPKTIRQAMRISGITPVAISILLIYIKKLNSK